MTLANWIKSNQHAKARPTPISLLFAICFMNYRGAGATLNKSERQNEEESQNLSMMRSVIHFLTPRISCQYPDYLARNPSKRD